MLNSGALALSYKKQKEGKGKGRDQINKKFHVEGTPLNKQSSEKWQSMPSMIPKFQDSEKSKTVPKSKVSIIIKV